MLCKYVIHRLTEYVTTRLPDLLPSFWSDHPACVNAMSVRAHSSGGPSKASHG